MFINWNGIGDSEEVIPCRENNIRNISTNDVAQQEWSMGQGKGTLEG